MQINAAADDHRAAEELRGADPEDQPAHRPKPPERQLEPDREEQEDDAELGERLDAVRRSRSSRNGATDAAPASAPSPDGPAIIPTRMNPMIGVIRIRAKAGMTIPAAPRITSASLKPGSAESAFHRRVFALFAPNGGRG